MNPLYRIGISLMLLVLTGCGGEDWKAETFPTTGSLLINGEPASGALVHLYPTGEAIDIRHSKPWAKVAPGGSFQLTTYEMGDGAPTGEYAVTIVWPEDASKPSTFDQLSRRYDKPNQSQWNVTIVEGNNELEPIALEGVKLAKPDGRTTQKVLEP